MMATDKPKKLTLSKRVYNLELIVLKLLKEVKKMNVKNSNPIGFNSYTSVKDLNIDDPDSY